MSQGGFNRGQELLLSNPEGESAVVVSKFDVQSIEPSTHRLTQNYFSRAQLEGQENYEISRGRQGVYFGGMYNGMRHGWGVYITKSSLYEGHFSLNHKMGKGYMVFPNGSTYYGDFVNDKPHGHGLLTMGEEYYMGDFENGTMEGDGLWKNGKGEKYVGRWKSSKANGQGIYSTDKSHYQGGFVQFVKQGYGMQSFTNGDQYMGYYLNGKPHGRGEYLWSNGARYRGQFLNGIRQGEGEWASQNGDYADRKNGYGEFKWGNGNSYKGQFCEDMREGTGSMAWTDGSTYEGEWQRGLPNGRGIFKARGQKARVGVFEDNILVNESKHKQLHIPSDVAQQSQTQLLGMIPEVTRRKQMRRPRNRSVYPSSANSTSVTFKINRRSGNRSSKK